MAVSEFAVVVILISTAVGVVLAVLLSIPGTFHLQTRLSEQVQRMGDLKQRPRMAEPRTIELPGFHVGDQ